MTTTLPQRLVAVAIAFALPALVAQTPPPTSAPSPQDQETVTLSPFEVRASQDSGYVGQDTLSGSRLRTSLKDLGAAISPMTAEYLKDISATSITDAMEYGVGTRMDTDDARSAGPVGDTYGGTRSIRVRGLPGASRSVNFFSAADEVDIYMIDRIEVSRGPNSILYGFGSPAGKINVMPKQAMTNKNAYSFTNRVDSWGGQRNSLDANTVLIKGKLALRTNILHGEESSWRAAGYNDQDRIFLAAKWQIDPKTTIKAEYEYGKAHRFVPRPFYGIDLKSIWDANGQLILDNFPSGPDPYNYTPGATFVQGQPGTPGTPVRDLNGGVTFNGVRYNYTDIPGVAEKTTNDYVVYSPSFGGIQNYKNFNISQSPSTLTNDIAMGLANPKAVIDANWTDNRSTAKTASIFIQREFFHDFNAELVLNRTYFLSLQHNLNTWQTLGIAADVNKYLPNGQLKPANLLYYVDMSGMQIPASNDVTQGRLSLSWEKVLGKYLTLRFAGMGEMSDLKSRSAIMQQYWLNSAGGAFNPQPENAANQVVQRYYLTSLSQAFDPNFRIPGPADYSKPFKYTDPKTGVVRDIFAEYINRGQGNVNYVDRSSRAGMLVGQAFLLKDRLVFTGGYRKDKVTSRVGVAFRDPAAEAIATGTGVWTPQDPSAAVPTTISGHTTTAGAVLHVTGWLAAFYNQSDSLGVPGTNFITPHDPTTTTIADFVKQPSGKTKDYGLKLTLLKDRIFVTATKFHTISKNEFGFSGFNKSNPVNIWNALANAPGLSADEKLMAQRQNQVINQVQGYMMDSESKGMEVEIVGRLLPNWSVSASYSKNETQRSNIGNEYRAYIDYWKPYWKKYAGYALTQNPNAAAPAMAVSSTDWRTPDEIRTTGDVTINTDSINEAIADTEALFYANPHAFEGKRFAGDPLHSLNLRTKYDFHEGALKGLTIGMGMRIRKGRIAGARSDYTYASGSDLTDTWNGRVTDSVTMVSALDQNVYDGQIGYVLYLDHRKIRWDIQLNVNNLTNQRDLIYNNINGVTLAPIAYRYQDPRQFILTNTFSF